MGAFRLKGWLGLAVGLWSCTSAPPTPPLPARPAFTLAAQRPIFSAESAYVAIERQLAFGPRIPGTSTHRACGDWLKAELLRRGARLTEQIGTYKGTPIRNFIASFGDTVPHGRVLLSAHWDSRPRADRDPQNPNAPVPGANDGASGVAVLLELARLFAQQPLPYPVDIALWDAEDLGQEGVEDSYCLGSQYWLEQPRPYPPQAYTWGIHLDMVGGRGATFFQEGYSRQYAPFLTERIWQVAAQLGYGGIFRFAAGEPILDDPFYLSSRGHIPVCNIIQRTPGQGFFPEWHTTQDDLSVIDKNTLQAVGETLVAFLYSFSPQSLSPK
ncbi:MAG: M28 family peptidase [Bacteroidia bacterium]